jgi:hypothetical protein
MNALLLVLTICTYILSIVGALLMGMVSARLNPNFLRAGIAMHFALLAMATIAYLTRLPATIQGVFLLLGVCTGLIFSGWALRNKQLSMYFRIYLGAYLISILVFIWSPSLLFYSISGHWNEYRPEQQIHLKGNHYLVEQQSMLQGTQGEGGYKVIRKYGIYNKTLVRDLRPKGIPKTARLTEITGDSMRIDLVFADGSQEALSFRAGMKRNRIERRMSPTIERKSGQ